LVDRALAGFLIVLAFVAAPAGAKPPVSPTEKAPADLVIDSIRVSKQNNYENPPEEQGEWTITYGGSKLIMLPGDGSDNELEVVVRNQGFSDVSRSFQVSLSLARGRSLSPVSGGTHTGSVPSLAAGQSHTLTFSGVKVSCALKDQPDLVYVARADSGKRVTEASKTNNSRTLNIQKNTHWANCP
jgi:hypothetical protein